MEVGLDRIRLPRWNRRVNALSIVVPGLLAFTGAFGGHILGRRTAREQDRWRQREETMRLLRWASELATERDDEERHELGAAALRALAESPILDIDDEQFVNSVALAAMRSHD